MDACNCCNKKKAEWYCEGILPEEHKDAIDADLRSFNMGLWPSIYEGDIVLSSNYHLSGVTKKEDTTYMLVAPTDSYAASQRDNKGLIYAFENNTIVNGFPKSIIVGHGNGFTYDAKNDKFLIAPIWTYTGGSHVDWPVIIEYNSDFSSYEIKATSNLLMSIAYNHIDEVVYGCNWGHEIFVYSGGNTTKLTDIKIPFTINYELNQGFAVKGNYFLISSADNQILIGKLSTGEVFMERDVYNIDYSRAYQLGELEDFDFTASGELLAARFVNLDSHWIDAICTTIIYDHSVNAHPFDNYALTNASWTITDASVAAFKNTFTTCKHPVQMNIFSNTATHPSRLNINSSVDFGSFDLSCDLVINITGNLTVAHIGAYRRLVINNDVSGATLTVSGTNSNVIQITRLSDLSFTGSENISIINAVNNIFGIRFDAYQPYIKIRSNMIINGVSTFTNGSRLHIGDIACENDVRGLYIGSNRIWNGV